MSPALLALGAAVGWGAADFLAARASRAASSVVVLALAQFVGLLAVGVAVLAIRPTQPSGALAIYAVGSGVALAVALGCLYEGMRVGSVSVVAPISATAVAIPVVFGLATGDALTATAFAGLLLAFAGVTLASIDRSGGRSAQLGAGVALAFAAAAAGGLNILLLDAASDDGVLWTIFIQRLTVTVLATAVASIRRHSLSVPTNVVRPVVAIGLLDVTATASFAAAAAEGQISVVSMLAALYPVVTVLLAHAVLSERISRTQQLGVVFALVGIALLVATRDA